MDSHRPSRVLQWIKRHPLATYFLLAYAISWVFAAPLVASTQGLTDIDVSPNLHYLVLSGPILAAVLVTAVTTGKAGLRSLAARMVLWRGRVGWILVAALSPVVILLLTALFLWISGAGWPDLARLAQSESLPMLGPLATTIVMILAAVEEEVGWRGYALPKLQEKRTAFGASMLLSVIWFLWHLPMFWYRATFASPTAFMFLGVYLGLAAGTIILTWLYNSTGGSLLATILWHGVWSTIAASNLGDQVPALMSMLFIVWAILLVIVYKPARLSRTGDLPGNQARTLTSDKE